MVIISGLILFKYIYEESIILTQFHHYNDDFMDYIDLFKDNLFSNTDKFYHLTRLQILSYLDFIIYGLITIAMVWEMLFSYYRYYSTIVSAKYFYQINLSKVLKSFSIHIMIFVTLLIIQTQFYFWSLPIVILYYFVTNIFWINKVAQLLISSYEQLTESLNTDFKLNQFQTDLIHCVKIMRKLSMISSVLSTINIIAFTVIYNMKIVYYFPIIWSLSILSFVFNFVRNRQYLNEKCCFYSSFCRKIPSITRLISSPDVESDDSLPSTVLQLAPTTSEISPPVSNRNTQITIPTIAAIPTSNQIQENLDRNHRASRSYNSLPIQFRNHNQTHEKRINLENYVSHSDNTNLNTNLTVNKNDHVQILRDGQIDSIDSIGETNDDKETAINFNLQRPIQLTKIDIDKISLNKDIESQTRTKTIPSPQLYAPSVTGSINGNHEHNEGNLDFDDGTVICVYDDGNTSNLKLEVIESNASIPPNSSTSNISSIQDSEGKKQPRSYSDAKPYHSGLKNVYKINTPQSMNQMKKYENKSLSVNSNNQSHLKLNLFDSTFDTEIIDESMDFDTQNLQLSRQFYHKTAPSTPPPPTENINTTSKQMSQLALPTFNGNKKNMIRSSSNPLLIINNTNEDISYDLSFINIEQNKPQLNKLNSVPAPKSRNNSFVIQRQRTNSHQKAQSGNDMQQLAPFTLIDALKSVQNERKSKRSNLSKRMRHSPNESVVSVLNLFAAQGFCSKRSINSVQQINKLTATPNESMQISNRNLFNVSMQI